MCDDPSYYLPQPPPAVGQPRSGDCAVRPGRKPQVPVQLRVKAASAGGRVPSAVSDANRLHLQTV